MTSQINPNNIDGNYPIAGVSNNTQGMRDNFTNIKQNFQYAETEIDDLQSKVLLKAALTGTTLDNNMADNLIYAAKIQDFSATQVLLTATSGSIAIDYSAGHYQTIAMAGNISLSFTNFPAAGSVGMLRMQIIVDIAGRTMTLPSAVSVGTTGVQGYSANVITFAASGTFEFGFVTTNAGTAITLFDLNRPLNYYTNPVTIAANTVSTSSVTGALTVAGGVGIQGNLYVNGDIFGNVTLTDISVNTVTAVGNVVGGNVVGGNILTSGIVSATSNITGGNITAVTVVTTPRIVTNNIRSDDSSFITVEDGLNVEQGLVVTGNVTGGNILTGGLISATGNITSAGQIRSSSNVQGIGYTTGAGSLVAQTGSRTNGVTINAISGGISIFSAAGSGFLSTFQVLNNRVTATDVVIVTIQQASNTYIAWAHSVQNGAFYISFYSILGTAVDFTVINFAVIRAVQS